MTLRIGFAKGRGSADCMSLMKPAGLHLPDEFRSGRLTFHRESKFDLECFVVRGDDLPALLESGHLDAGVGSSIVFDENDQMSTRAVAALEIGQCRLSLIVPDGSEPKGQRLCTRYPRMAARTLAGAGSDWQLQLLHGCVETSLFLGMSDAIVDIIETGWTLRALNLREKLTLAYVRHEIRVGAASRGQLDRLRAIFPEVVWSDACKSSAVTA